MAFFDWNEKYCVKIEKLDGHHRKLLAMLEEFYRGVSGKSSQGTLLELIRKLEDYSIYHFTTEETLMQKYDFPGLKKHRQEHEAFIKKIGDYRARFESGKMIIGMDITQFVKNWLINHILKTDMAYSKYLTDRGVK